MTGIAHQYALAVFSLARESKREFDFIDCLNDFVCGLSEETYKFFAHPKISKAEKKAVLASVIKDLLLLHFVKVLVDNDRFSIIEAIKLSYKDILDNLNKVMNVTVVSNKQLTESNLDRIIKKLKKTYNRNIVIQTQIDTNIVGGFRIEFDGNIIDETINKQLAELKASLSE
jgi:F-type H+-transporting ATPase subunit delta